MKRRTIVAVAGLGLVLALACFASDPRPPARVDRWDEVPHLWRWTVAERRPDSVAREIALVVRSRRTPPVHPTTAPAEPLPAGAGTEKALLSEQLLPSETVDTRITLQINDLRQLGLPAGSVEWPMRMAVGLSGHGSTQDALVRIEGHSLLGQPVAHESRWENGELPLLSFRSAGEHDLWEWTYLLAIRPAR